MAETEMKIYQKPRFHEWRWNELVGPLIFKTGKDRHFFDIGCNAGFYMKKARAFGYKCKGIDIDDDYLSQAPKWLDVKKADINYYKPPCSFLTLMACVHYHQTDAQVEAILHNLMYSTVYLIIMGRHKGRTKSNPSRQHLMKKLVGWELIGYREAKAFYTVLVKNPRYAELDVDTLYDSTREFVSKINGFLDFVPSFEDFVRRTINGEDFDYRTCQFMDYLRKRKFRYKLGRCWIYKVMIDEIKKDGIHTALKVVDERIKDGYHRLIILRELGIKRVVCRVL